MRGEMIFCHETDLDTLDACLPQFLRITDAGAWARRTNQLAKAFGSSRYQAKIIIDYHWLEFALSEHIASFDANGHAGYGEVTIEVFSALIFAQTVVSVYSQLSSTGRRRLEGRLQNALKAETGFAPLYVEMSTARRLFDAGYEVEFSDLEGFAQFDLRFWKGDVYGEVECKSLSCDAGRKIHRKDFYRFVDTVADLLESRVSSGANEVFLITLQDRLPAAHKAQRALRQAVKDLISRPSLARIDGDFFAVTLQTPDPKLNLAFTSDQRAAYRVCQQIFGDNCHLSGAQSPDGTCLLVMRSQRPDDTSAALLDAMKKATTQFSRSRPAFIAVQYEDIEPSDLLLRSLRRKAGILSYYLFHRPESVHLAATWFCAYRGLVAGKIGVGEPAFLIPNPRSRGLVLTDYSPLFAHIPDADFAQLLGEPPPISSISHIPFDYSDHTDDEAR
jgi:hypothetical protein